MNPKDELLTGIRHYLADAGATDPDYYKRARRQDRFEEWGLRLDRTLWRVRRWWCAQVGHEDYTYEMFYRLGKKCARCGRFRYYTTGGAPRGLV